MFCFFFQLQNYKGAVRSKVVGLCETSVFSPQKSWSLRSRSSFGSFQPWKLRPRWSLTMIYIQVVGWCFFFPQSQLWFHQCISKENVNCSYILLTSQWKTSTRMCDRARQGAPLALALTEALGRTGEHAGFTFAQTPRLCCPTGAPVDPKGRAGGGVLSEMFPGALSSWFCLPAWDCCTKLQGHWWDHRSVAFF